MNQRFQARKTASMAVFFFLLVGTLPLTACKDAKNGSETKETATSATDAQKTSLARKNYVVVVESYAEVGKSERHAGYRTLEIVQTESGFEQVGFANGFQVPTPTGIWQFTREIDPKNPEKQNCACDGLDPETKASCVPEGEVTRLQLTSTTDATDNRLKLERPKGNDILYATLADYKTSVADHFFALTACYNVTHCSFKMSFECRSVVLDLDDDKGPTVVSLEQFADLPSPETTEQALDKYLKTLPPSGQTARYVRAARDGGNPLELQEVVFTPQSLDRRYVTQIDSDITRLSSRTKGNVDAWNTGTLSVFNSIRLDLPTSDSTLKSLKAPPAVMSLIASVDRENEKREESKTTAPGQIESATIKERVVGWVPGSLRKIELEEIK